MLGAVGYLLYKGLAIFGSKGEEWEIFPTRGYVSHAVLLWHKPLDLEPA